MGGDSSERRCQGEKADGRRCEAPAHMVNDRGWCPAHDPEREQERREAAKRGGQATARLHRNREPLTSDDLPPLDSYEAAEQWLEVVSRAMLDGRIPQARADTLRKALKTWVQTRDKGKLEDRFNQLEDALETYRDTGNPD